MPGVASDALCIVDVGLNMLDACVGENRSVFGHVKAEIVKTYTVHKLPHDA